MTDQPYVYLPFRRKLIIFAAIIVSVIAVPVLIIAIQQPWRVLSEQITVSDGIIAAAQESIPPEELREMNSFALARIPETASADARMRDYLDWTFNMHLLDGRLLTKNEISRTMQEYDLSPRQGFDYQEMKKAYDYWGNIFQKNPSALALFKKHKTYLIDVKRRTQSVSPDMADLYIMIDTGRKSGFFDSRIAFLLDGYPWYKSSFPGDIYEVPDDSRIRDDALAGRTGFGHNETTTPSRGFFPQFYSDQWGRWFSVWSTVGVDGAYNIVTIDFDAGIVERMMITVGISILIVSAILLTLIIYLTRVLSERYSRSPIELSRGIDHVSKGHYEYRIPVLMDEFSVVGERFNAMALKLRERDRLQDALEKVLSKELAEQAAKEGVMLGGQKANCTIMFTDFAGFSSITQYMDPHEIVDVLNEYFEKLIPVIKKYGGFPDKYIGDAIVAIFGAPIALPDHAERAVRCAIEMQKTMRKLNDRRRKKGKLVFEMRIGLNTGDVLVGAIGCDMKLEYTSIGESTNLANRMEANCTIGNILLSRNTYSAVRTEFLEKHEIVLSKKTLPIKGYRERMDAYEIRVAPFTIGKNAEEHDPSLFYTYQPIGE